MCKTMQKMTTYTLTLSPAVYGTAGGASRGACSGACQEGLRDSLYQQDSAKR